MKCKYCDFDITELQNKTYKGCCDDICLNRYERKSHKNEYCRLCGIRLKEKGFYDGFCSGGCAGEFQEVYGQ